MKLKQLLTTVSIATLSTIAFTSMADTPNGYYSMQASMLDTHPHNKSIMKTTFTPTDITVIDARTDAINLRVPNTGINDIIYPSGYADHIHNNGGAFNTTIMLYDPYNRLLFNGTVCPRAVVIAYNTLTVVDPEYCN